MREEIVRDGRVVCEYSIFAYSAWSSWLGEIHCTLDGLRVDVDHHGLDMAFTILHDYTNCL